MRRARRPGARRRALAALVAGLLLAVTPGTIATVPGSPGQAAPTKSADVPRQFGRGSEEGKTDHLPAKTQDSGNSCGSDADGGKSQGEGDEESGGSEVRVVRKRLQEASADVLRGYRDASGCVLARAGYVDLLGRCWSCTVVGDGWVDTVVVRSTEDGSASEVRTVRMDASEWEAEAPVE